MAEVGLESLLAGTSLRYVITVPVSLPVEAGPVSETVDVMALVVMTRAGGFLLAVPSEGIDIGMLNLDTPEGQPVPFGPHTTMVVPGLSGLADGAIPTDDVEVLLVDVEDHVRQMMSPLDDVAGFVGVGFAEDTHTVPNPVDLVAYAQDWIALQQQPRVQFYSAAEEEQPPLEEELPPTEVPPLSQAKAKPKVKKPTTASLAEEIRTITDLLPALTNQIAQLQQGQKDMVAKMQAQEAKSRLRPSQLPVSAPLQQFAKMMGSPPRTKMASPSTPKDRLQTEPQEVEDQEEDLERMPGGGLLAQAVLQQSRALTSLVSQLSNADPLLELHAGGSGMSLGSKGAQGREKLQTELASRSGNFCLAVAQNAFRRMRPAQKVPSKLEDFRSTEFSMVTYLEKFGGYGNFRELGLIQFCLAHVMDAAIQNDIEGVQEHIALTMTALEQAVMDGNKWDLAYQLTLLEEPASQLWTYRNQMPHSRLKAFAPLCPQRWATVALAFTKEVDYIANRRVELTKKPQPSQASDPPAAPKKKGKNGKGGGEGKGSEANADA